MPYCPDCGCKVYNGVCTNCHEEIYIAEQYSDLNMPMPEDFRRKLEQVEIDQSYYAKRKDVKRELKQ